MEELKVYYPYIISLVVGTLLPALLALVFPRRLTVKYGMALYQFVGALFLQSRATLLRVNGDAWSRLGCMVRTTFVDLSFGIYIASRLDLDPAEKDTKITEYLKVEPGVDIEKVKAKRARKG